MAAHSEAPGLVLARHRRRIELEAADGTRVSCIADRRLEVLCGDRVLWRRDSHGTALVTRRLPRDTLLTRIDSRARREPVAANLNQLIAVVAPVPAPDRRLLDRYLAAAELMGIEAAIVFNKCDLAAAPPELDVYARIGYAVLSISASEATGLEALLPRLADRRSALLGQSGTGKSSLLNALVGARLQAVAALGGRGAHGRHTTTTAVLHRLPTGGELLDTPGVRHYAPHIDAAADVARGFRELAAYSGRCRFADCLHRDEPDCAVKRAVETGAVARARYESYLALVNVTERR